MEIEIPKNSEYRIEVSESQKVRIMITTGLAEICGQELLNEKWYSFSNIKTAIFSFTGAKLKIEGEMDLQYIANTPTFRKIFNFFDLVKNDDTLHTVLVLGRGRTTFCTTLANYSVKMHRKVDLIELDPSKGNVFPGTLSLVQIETLIDYQDRIKLNNPFCMFYGTSELENKELFDVQVNRILEELESRNKNNLRLVLAPEMSNDDLNGIIKKFRVTHVVVMGNERLFHRLNLLSPKVFIENTGYQYENTMNRSISRYFNGSNGEFTPASFIVKHEWGMFRIGEQYTAPDSALPLGASRKIGRTDVCRSELTDNVVLAISEAETEEQMITAPVVGFIVCLDSKKFRVLCTQTKLPKLKYLIQGTINYIDY